MERKRNWHASDIAETIRRLDTDGVRGLSQATALQRLELYGPNALTTVGRTPWYRVLLRQFADALILILVVAAGSLSP